jgi:uncharacterized protein (TIGR03083 family)
MNEDQVWLAVDAHRLALLELLQRLSDEQWRQPSLCAGWTVRDVAAHLAWQQQVWTPATVLGFLRARGRMDQAIQDIARRHAHRPVEQLIAQFRRTVGTRKPVPSMTCLETLIDTLVHGQDIGIPLGQRLDLAPEAAAVAATRIWTKDTLLPAVKSLKALRFTATDTDWSIGDGPEIRGPITAILLLFTGRPAATSELTGEGVTALAQKIHRGR